MNDEAEYKLKCLRAAVEAMRKKQKEYFAMRTSTALRHAKELEAQVDKMLQEP